MGRVRKDLKEAVRSGEEKGLRVVAFEGKGRGVVTTKKFKKNDFVAHYKGELISGQEAERRDNEYGKNMDTRCYMFFFEFRRKKWCIDATAETDNFGRLINHSKKGNVIPKIFGIKSIPHLVFLAKEDINPGDEVSFDYGERRKDIVDHYSWLRTDDGSEKYMLVENDRNREMEIRVWAPRFKLHKSHFFQSPRGDYEGTITAIGDFRFISEMKQASERSLNSPFESWRKKEKGNENENENKEITTDENERQRLQEGTKDSLQERREKEKLRKRKQRARMTPDQRQKLKDYYSTYNKEKRKKLMDRTAEEREMIRVKTTQRVRKHRQKINRQEKIKAHLEEKNTLLSRMIEKNIS